MKEYEKIRFLAKASVLTEEPPVDTIDQEVEDAVENEYVDTQPDLIRIQAVLVSTGINKNGHVFLPEELYPARNTASHKPMNINHDDSRIVGHISNSHLETKSGELIPEPEEEEHEEDIPQDFDVISESVMYAQIFQEEARNIRERALRGELFVSVEAWYGGYDYLVGNRIVERNTVTQAYLDPALILRGGTGFIEEEQVSMVLRDLIIAGIGLVKAPANERSEIRSVNSEQVEKVTESVESDIIDLQTILENHTKGFIEQQEACMAGDKNKMKASASKDGKLEAATKEKKKKDAAKEEPKDEKGSGTEETGEAEKGADESAEDAESGEAKPEDGEEKTTEVDDVEETSGVDPVAELKKDMDGKMAEMQKKLDERDSQLATYQRELDETKGKLGELEDKTKEQPKAEKPPKEEEKPKEDPPAENEGSKDAGKDEEANEATSDKETQPEAEPKNKGKEEPPADNTDSGTENVDDTAIEDAVDDALNDADKEEEVVDFTSDDDGESSLFDEFVEVLDNLDIGLNKSEEDKEEKNGSKG